VDCEKSNNNNDKAKEKEKEKDNNDIAVDLIEDEITLQQKQLNAS